MFWVPRPAKWWAFISLTVQIWANTYSSHPNGRQAIILLRKSWYQYSVCACLHILIKCWAYLTLPFDAPVYVSTTWLHGPGQPLGGSYTLLYVWEGPVPTVWVIIFTVHEWVEGFWIGTRSTCSISSTSFVAEYWELSEAGLAEVNPMKPATTSRLPVLITAKCFWN